MNMQMLTNFKNQKIFKYFNTKMGQCGTGKVAFDL